MIKPDKLRFGTAGIPLSTQKSNTLNGIAQVRKLGLDAMELEFVRFIHLKKDKAPAVKQAAQENDVMLSNHAPYAINLNSKDPKIKHASINRILQSARVMALAGGYSVCMHAAYYSGATYSNIKDKMTKYFKDMVKTLQDEGHKIWVRPETGGKINQFADSYDLIDFTQDLDMVLPCFDLAHQYSRTLGKWNTYDDFHKLFTAIEKTLGKEGLHNLHCHMEGIAFTDKGEKNHLNFSECDFNYKDVMKVLKEFNAKGVIICESPNIEADALAMQKVYQSL